MRHIQADHKQTFGSGVPCLQEDFCLIICKSEPKSGTTVNCKPFVFSKIIL